MASYVSDTPSLANAEASTSVDSLGCLYWSTHGEVACAEHAPDIGDSRWVKDGWALVPLAIGRVHRSRYQCQHCAVDGRAFVKRPGAQRPDSGLYSGD
jgi:hypothetical protein